MAGGVEPNFRIEGLPRGEYAYYLQVAEHRNEYEFEDSWDTDYTSCLLRLRAAFHTERFYEGNDNIWILRSRENGNDVKLVLYNSDGFWLVLRFRCSYMYLVGFVNKHGSYKFKDMKVPGWTNLKFGSSYKDLKDNSGHQLFGLKTGMLKLKEVLLHLGRVTGEDGEQTNEKMKATALLTCALMFAEAARFDCIAEHFTINYLYYESISEDHVMYILNWSKISKCLIAAKAHPESIVVINQHVEEMKLTLIEEGRKVETVGDLQNTIRVLSNQRLEDCLGLLNPLAN